MCIDIVTYFVVSHIIKMLKSCRLLLLLSILNFSIPSSKNLNIKSRQPLNRSTHLHRYVITILNQCELEIKNVIIYDYNNNLLTYEDFSVLQPKFALTITSNLDKNLYNKKLETTETEGIVIVGAQTNRLSDLISQISSIWRCKRQCTVFFIPRPFEGCKNGIKVLKEMSFIYATYIYYFCFENHSRPVVYTYNPYGNATTLFWQAFKRELFNKNEWTFYRRQLQTNAECHGFIFNRTTIAPHNYIVLRLRREILQGIAMHSTREGFYDSEIIKRKMHPIYRDNVDSFRKMLQFKFLFSLTYSMKSDTDIHFVEHPLKFVKYGDPSFPSYYTFYVIASHNQGLFTPLERIGKFYGIWTLISLIIIVIISFIVIWIKADKKIHIAAFDILRFLINSGISIAINTLPLKIFFSVIFLYFLVIHATFSGHLAEFLTIPVLRKNIDSIKDLSDPRIETIRKFGYSYENDEIEELLESKSVIPNSDIECMQHTIKDPKSVCLVFQDSAFYFATHPWFKWPNWYFSKEFSETPRSYTYQPRFSLREKFDSAIMTMTETQVLNRVREVEKTTNILTLEKEKVRSEIHFRMISFKDVGFAFILLSIGLCLAFVCFLFENILGRKYNFGLKRKNRKRVRTFLFEEKKSNSLLINSIFHKKLSKKSKITKIIVMSE